MRSIAGNGVFISTLSELFSGAAAPSALPLTQAANQTLIFSHLVSTAEHFTGLAILNPGETDLSVTVQVFDQDAKP